jgi:hypothetical protein
MPIVIAYVGPWSVAAICIEYVGRYNGGGAGDNQRQRSVIVEIREISTKSHPVVVMGILHAPLVDKRYADAGFPNSIKLLLWWRVDRDGRVVGSVN